MNGAVVTRLAGLGALLALGMGALVLSSCGGGSASDRGTNKTFLSVAASDADGDALQYQWRVTAGSIDNRNAPETVWTLPDGPGLHFAYVIVSDGKGGYAERQYVVSSDNLGPSAPVPAPVNRQSANLSDAEFDGGTVRLAFRADDTTRFAPSNELRWVYRPDVQVRLSKAGVAAFDGTTDLGGELVTPKLPSGTYQVSCNTVPGVAPAAWPKCGDDVVIATDAIVSRDARIATLAASRNLRLYGHVGLSDGGVCGARDEFFGLESTATVQLLQAVGAALGAQLRVNRFGDYALDAAVVVDAPLKLSVRCEGYETTLDVAPPAGGFVATSPVEVSHVVPNARPRIVKVVANGPEGSVRGQEFEQPEPSFSTTGLPGAEHFLTYKGRDTRLSACLYYRSFGAVADCDAQGNFVDPISMEDWRRQHKFKPYDSGNTVVHADYINRMDLNLVRRMEATEAVPGQDISFVVCNAPGPEGRDQHEINDVIEIGLADEKRVACVAMEWSVTPGTNNDQPFTKFLTFGPDGRLIPSINLDGRGEKYMPGACVACHGGTRYGGRFPEHGRPSANMAARFLPFDTGNFLFADRDSLGELAQGEAFYNLNQLVRATEPQTVPPTATTALIDGWYASSTTVLDKSYVPPAWREANGAPTGAERFYHEVVATSCRTCHTAFPNFNWDGGNPGQPRLLNFSGSARICGGSAQLAVNAVMPNALISRDRMQERLSAEPDLAALMRGFLGCDTPNPDPVYPQR
jgi:mono/diheme cytochrome c family protein